MPNPTNIDLINAERIGQFDINHWNGVAPCEGLTLLDLRIRLRNILSNYTENTLISDDINNDIERQWINDGIGSLWPHDWQMVFKSFIIQPNQTEYVLPDDCEHVVSVFVVSQDINNAMSRFQKIPHYDGWTYDNAFIDASVLSTTAGGWTDRVVKAVVLRDPAILGPLAASTKTAIKQFPWVAIRYVRRWSPLEDNNDCIDPTPNRIQAIVYYAAAQYFSSQFQVSTESIRYQNYIQIGQQFQQMATRQLLRDSKPLYFS
jgi:hypothetical protein